MQKKFTDEDYKHYLENQPKKKVRGSKFFVPYCGTTYTFLYNMRPVSISFDDMEHEYPVDVANELERKLDAIAQANVRVEQNVKLTK